MLSLTRSSAARWMSASRTYATTTSPKIPLTLHGIDGRYATALYSAAHRENAIKSVQSDLAKFNSVLEKNPKLRLYLETPLADRDAKLKAISGIIETEGAKFSPLLKNFITVLAENSRLDQTTKIVEGFEKLVAAGKGEVTVVVTSAQELDKSVQTKLTSMLKGSPLVEKSQDPILVTKVDPSIMGGLIIEIGEKTIDLSVSAKINKLNRLLTEAI